MVATNFLGRETYLCPSPGERRVGSPYTSVLVKGQKQTMTRNNRQLGSGGIATDPSKSDNYWEGLKVSYSMKNWEKHIRSNDE